MVMFLISTNVLICDIRPDVLECQLSRPVDGQQEDVISVCMDEQKQPSRDRIIEAANHLFYTKGYNQTSIADVADSTGITKGNLHYHFHSKEELLDAIINYRRELYTRQLALWDKQYHAPKEKLDCFVNMLLNQETELVRYGCPIGSLNVELGKFQETLQEKSLELFDLFQQWLEKIFRQLNKKNSKSLSQHLLAMAQGAALMAYVYDDTKILRNECKNIKEWIATL